MVMYNVLYCIMPLCALFVHVHVWYVLVYRMSIFTGNLFVSIVATLVSRFLILCILYIYIFYIYKYMTCADIYIHACMPNLYVCVSYHSTQSMQSMKISGTGLVPEKHIW